jgi:23S rRNA pseudouridine2605 synthase
LASRRKCEELVRQGRITVNQQVVAQLATQVDPDHDQVALDGKVLRIRTQYQYILLHKPKAFMVSKADPQGRPLIMELLPAALQHLFPIGRLDFNTEGALLLTDDGALSNYLLHPRYHVYKTYRCWLEGTPSIADLKKLERGVNIDGEHTLPATVIKILTSPEENYSIVDIKLREGRNRQIRRMMEAVNIRLTRLIRTTFAGVELADLEKGKWRYLTPVEIARLQKMVPDGGLEKTNAGTK